MLLSASPVSHPILSALRCFLPHRSPTSLYLENANSLSTITSKFPLNSKCLMRVLLRRFASFMCSVKSKLVLITLGQDFLVIGVVFRSALGRNSSAFWVLYLVPSSSLSEKCNLQYGCEVKASPPMHRNRETMVLPMQHPHPPWLLRILLFDQFTHTTG